MGGRRKPPPPAGCITTADACRRLYTSGRSIQKWVATGRLDPIRVGENVYVTLDSVLRVGLELGMSETQVLAPQKDEEDFYATEPKEFVPRPVRWREGEGGRPPGEPSKCKRCGRRIFGGWCVSCGGDYD